MEKKIIDEFSLKPRSSFELEENFEDAVSQCL